MNTIKTPEYLISLVHELCKQTRETEWVEFKVGNEQPEAIGEYISALSNAAAYNGKVNAYMIWGVQDETHDIVGTTFSALNSKVGGEELESWLLRLLAPKVNFHFYEIEVDGKAVVVLEIGAAFRHPVQFKHVEYIRVGSYKKKLKEFQEKERELWRCLDQTPFEVQLALENVDKDKVFELIDYTTYFELLQRPIPDGHKAILAALVAEDIIQLNEAGNYSISNLGAILFAKDLSKFSKLSRKAVRVVQYKGNNKLETVRELQGNKGYAVGFDGLVNFIMTLIPAEESLTSPIRKEKTMFPELAVRELVANSLIHQDFFETGSGVMVELFADRLEISNPGEPLVNIDRFLDSPPKSRNEKLASLMRRLGICEERGSGIDKVIFEVEFNQLPAPIFERLDKFTRVVLFSHRELKNLTKQDRVRACYFHASLKYIERDYMTNTSLRERFGIDTKNGAMASRIIKDALQSGLICIYDESVGAKARRYIPKWARE